MQGSTVDDDLLRGSLARFGLTDFRPGQRDVINSVLARRDVLCVMPTGGGKSLCYQLPSLIMNGLTIVVSPLIALMKDQEDQLQRLGIGVAAIHSGLDAAEQRARLSSIESGAVSLCYIAPERLRSPRFLEAISRVGVAALAVDEAHCISEWGHDFRPDYARLGWFRRQLQSPPTIALTATATDVVRRDIVEQLQLNDPAIFVRGFDRPNLHYHVHHVRQKNGKLSLLAEILDATPGSVVIYGASRKSCEEVVEFLRSRGPRRVALYHAGLQPADRRASQDAFMTGDAEIIVATNAFGMGVDKPDIRAVIHFNLPGTVEAYYQEAGRAGRDGEPARCDLLYSPSDRYIQEFFIEGEYPSRSIVLKVCEFLRTQPEDLIELTRQELKEKIGGSISEMAIGASLKILESAGVVERLRSRENMAILRLHETGPDLADLLPSSAKTQARVLRHLDRMVGARRGEDYYFHPAQVAAELEMERGAFLHALREISERISLDFIPPFRGSATRLIDRETPARELPIDFAALAARKDREREKLDRMIEYAQEGRCRRQSILAYFGESIDPCGRCDVCDSRPTSANGSTDAGGELGPIARVVLRAIEDVRGRAGKTTLAAALAGSKAQSIQKKGLAQREWHGQLGGCRQKDLVELIHALQLAGCVQQAGEALRPTVVITEAGKGVLVNGESLPEHLSLSLEIRRSLIQGAKQTLPAAGVMMDEQSPPAAEDDSNWTLHLVRRGYRLDDVAAIRRLKVREVLAQLTAAVGRGEEFPMAPIGMKLVDPADERERVRLISMLRARGPATGDEPEFIPMPVARLE